MSINFLRDKAFFRAMLAIAIPVAFQQLISAGLNMLDVIMVGTGADRESVITRDQPVYSRS